MPAAIDYSRLQRADWDKLGPSALAKELFDLLTATKATTTATSSSGTASAVGDGVGNARIGTVVSGSGASYQVTLDTGDKVSVTVPDILTTETAPTGFSFPVVQKTDGTYLMHVPLWLDGE